MGWVRVDRSAEVPEGGFKEFDRPVRIVVARREARLHGFDPVCPHMGDPLAQGSVVDCSICCPWHHYRFDLATGENVYSRSVYPAYLAVGLPSLKVRPVREIDGGIEPTLKVGAR